MLLMKKKHTYLLPAALLAMLFCLTCRMQPPDNPLPAETSTLPEEEELSTEHTYVPGEIVIKAADNVSLAELDALVPGQRVKKVTVTDGNTYYLYRLLNEQDTDTVLYSLMAGGKVQHVEKNAIYRLCFLPNDSYYQEYQYAPQITHCEAGWDIETGSNNITVAVIDTGINGEHEELQGRVLGGWDVVKGEEIPPGVNSDDNGHGSHVAGIIGAAGDNGVGIAGVAWDVNLMPVKTFAQGFFTTTVHIAEGMVWAVDHDADIINMSLVGQLFSMAVNDAVNYANKNNVVIVAGMGNDFRDQIEYPAALPGVIAVGATNGRDELSHFSTKGQHISVTAPGESIYSLRNTDNSGYTYSSGTSMAAPFVTGLAALLLSNRPGLNPAEVRSMIEDSADPLGTGDFNHEFGHGRVNVYNALTSDVHNNYNTIIVNITNRGEPVGGVKVLIEDNNSHTIVQSGITSYGGISGGESGRLFFRHLKAGSYKIRAHVGNPRETNILLLPARAAQEVSFAFDTPMVLIVNGIKEMDTSLLTDEFLYAKALSGLGKYYTMWKTIYYGPPTYELMSAYDMIVWYTGKTSNDPEKNIEVLSGEEIRVIQNYLDSGGLLYLCGNNIAEHLAEADSDFLENYLHARYVTSPLSHDEIFGAGFLQDMQILLYLEDDDQIEPGPGATGILDASDEPDENHWGGVCWAGDYRLVFTTICPNEVLYADPDTFFESIINWLDIVE
jgi:subtilisin family serine protease